MTLGLTVRAPGRVNLIGEHTDYNDGLVLPAAIDLEIRIDLVPRADRLVRLELAADGRLGQLDLDAIGAPTGGWLDYVAGVALELTRSGLPTGGLDGRLSATLPASAGLSSSAALELAAAWALLSAADGFTPNSVERLALARLCQRAENDYVGVRTGLMDQFAASCGEAGCALLLDCRSLDYRPVVLPRGLQLVVVETGAKRRLAASEYNQRRSECERGVDVLRARGEQVASLRDATLDMLDRAATDLGDVVYRRCRHVVEENTRTLAAVRALESDDRIALGELFAASHTSLRDLYEVSSPALDAAVDVATATRGVVASRMTGGGFGGCTVNLVEPDVVDALRSALERDYVARTGLAPVVHLVTAASGAGLVESVQLR
ncbi:MAG: galactokinase [Chloroflexota bacterium]